MFGSRTLALGFVVAVFGGVLAYIHKRKREIKQLYAPITMADLLGTQRLRKLLLRNAEDVVDILLLDSRRLRNFIREGGRLQRRQDLQRDNPEVFSTEEEVRELLGDMERLKHWQPGDVFVSFPGIGALSYARILANDPDPEGAQLEQLAKALEWLEAQRLFQKDKDHFGQESGRFALMIDVASLFQPDCAGQRTEAEATSFHRALHNLGMFYAHAKTITLKISQTPSTRAVSDPRRVFGARGWVFVEEALATLLARREYSLDLSLWGGLDERLRTAFSNSGEEEDEEELVARLKEGIQGEVMGSSYAQLSVNPVLLALGGEGGRGAALTPADLERELGERAFSAAGDAAECAGVYSRTAEPIFREKRAVVLAGVEYAEAEWQQLGRSLPLHASVQRLEFSGCGLTGARLRRLVEALAAHPRLPVTTVILSNEPLGEPGAEALGAWLRSGQLGALRRLEVGECGLGAGGWAAVAAAVAESGVGGRLEALGVRKEALGAAGAAGLLPARRGALPALQELSLRGSELGDAGAGAVGAALGEGALPGLKVLDLRGVGMGAEGAAAVAAGLHAGGVASQAVDLVLARNSIGDRGLAALLESALLRLRCLDVRGCEDGAEGSGRAGERGVSADGWGGLELALRAEKLPRLSVLCLSSVVQEAHPSLVAAMSLRGGQIYK